jgi:hypothetical protein
LVTAGLLPFVDKATKTPVTMIILDADIVAEQQIINVDL